MSCVDGVCEKDSQMQLRDCKTKGDLDATFSVIFHGDGGTQFRISNTNLCLQKMGDQRAIKLKPCKEYQPLQLFVGYESGIEKFDIRPVNYTDRCLSNHHHPKANEMIYAETCKKAHRTDTGYWIAYSNF